MTRPSMSWGGRTLTAVEVMQAWDVAEKLSGLSKVLWAKQPYEAKLKWFAGAMEQADRRARKELVMVFDGVTGIDLGVVGSFQYALRPDACMSTSLVASIPEAAVRYEQLMAELVRIRMVETA